MAENKIKLVQAIFEGLVNIIKVLKCKITCCRSSCNTSESVTEKNV